MSDQRETAIDQSNLSFSRIPIRVKLTEVIPDKERARLYLLGGGEGNKLAAKKLVDGPVDLLSLLRAVGDVLAAAAGGQDRLLEAGTTRSGIIPAHCDLTSRASGRCRLCKEEGGEEAPFSFGMLLAGQLFGVQSS